MPFTDCGKPAPRILERDTTPMDFFASDLRFVLLHIVRCLTMTAMLPMFSHNAASRLAKLAVGVMLGFLLALQSSRANYVDPEVSLMLVFCVLREFVMGSYLAWIVVVLFAIIRTAGTLISEEMGFSVASIQDPITGVQSPAIGQFLEMIAMACFLSSGAHHGIFRALVSSFALEPVGTPTLDWRIFGVGITWASSVITSGLEIAAPIFATLLVAAIALGALSKVAPELQIMQFAFAIKVALGLVLFVALFQVFQPTFARMFDRCEETLIEIVR